MQILKRNKGITLVALIITIIILLILAGVSLSFVFNGGILDKAQSAINEYESASKKEQDLLDEIDKYIENELGGSSVDDNKNEPNPPELMEGMTTGVYWDENGNEVTVTDDNKDNWYNYSDKKWANAKTKDGSYWVWIPRFEYSIDGEDFDVNFIPVSQTTVDNGYTHIHPAFRDGSSTNYMNGEWDEEIAGFWITKYEAGFQECTQTLNSNGAVNEPSIDTSRVIYSDKNYTSCYDIYITNALGQDLSNENYQNEKISYPVFKPLTYSYNIIGIGDMYTISQDVAITKSFYGLDSNTTDSHMMKNSEWGAVMYLTMSEYGRKNENITLNSKNLDNMNSRFIYAVTGYAGDTPNGVSASSTNNMSGVFDLKGGLEECVPAYISGGASILKNGSSFATTTENEEGYKTLSTKYSTVYPYDINDKNDRYDNFVRYKELSNNDYGYGDGILEIYDEEAIKYNNTYLNGYANFWWPFFIRGMNYDYDVNRNDNIFMIDSTSGVAYFRYGFRVALIEK